MYLVDLVFLCSTFKISLLDFGVGSPKMGPYP